jgi:drug/metabolite transporter (DMT)-like permease
MWEAVVPIALFISFVWGATPIVHKYIFNSFAFMTPETMLVVGGILYFIFTMCYFGCNRAKVMEPLKQLPLPIFVLMGITALVGFLANYLYFNVIGKHASYLVSALIFSSPFFTLVLSYMLLKEDISITSFIAIILIVVGIIMLATSKKKKSH